MPCRLVSTQLYPLEGYFTMTDNLSSASIRAANAVKADVQAVEARAEGFFTKYEKALVIAGVVALFLVIGFAVASL